MARSTVYRVAERLRKWEEAGLLDGREDNGQAKLAERYLATFAQAGQVEPADPRLAASHVDTGDAGRDHAKEDRRAYPIRIGLQLLCVPPATPACATTISLLNIR